MPKSDIVFGSEFSPAVVQLPKLLDLLRQHQPYRTAVQNAIDAMFFAGKGRGSNPKTTLGDNTILAMTAYGLLARQDKQTVLLTEFGEQLYAKRESDETLKEMMGRHCLANLDGLKVVSCIRDLASAGIALKKDTIARRLREEGYHIPPNGKHLNVLRQWLEFAGILNPTGAQGGDALWVPDEERIKKLLGIDGSDIDRWSNLTRAQYDFARAFALMDVDEAVSSDVRDRAISLYGTEFPEGTLPQSILQPLEEAGLLQVEKITSGRGAKAHHVKVTAKLKNEFLEPILLQLANTMGQGYKRLARMSLAQIVSDLGSSEKHRKGIALEALGFFFCRRLDLSFVQWRLRSSATGGAEVDMVVEGTRLLFSRWQIQCKNTSKVATEDLAKEVGVATTIRSNVVMLISTGEIGNAVKSFAKKVMENTPLRVILVDKSALADLSHGGVSIFGLVNDLDPAALRLRPSLRVSPSSAHAGQFARRRIGSTRSGKCHL